MQKSLKYSHYIIAGPTSVVPHSSWLNDQSLCLFPESNRSYIKKTLQYSGDTSAHDTSFPETV